MRDKKPSFFIRENLKKAFPGVKFSVRYSSFAWGDSVQVERTGWPLEKQVDAIAQRNSAGTFNWMEDIYEYFDDDRPYNETAKYVLCNRRDDEQQTLERMEQVGMDTQTMIDWAKDLQDREKKQYRKSIAQWRFEDKMTNDERNAKYYETQEKAGIISRYIYCKLHGYNY